MQTWTNDTATLKLLRYKLNTIHAALIPINIKLMLTISIHNHKLHTHAYIYTYCMLVKVIKIVYMQVN